MSTVNRRTKSCLRTPRHPTSKVARACLCVPLIVASAGCSRSSAIKLKHAAAVPRVTVEEAPKWEEAISLADRERLKGLQSAWGEALGEASKGGYKRAVHAEGKLLDPGSALLSPAPSPGNYMCRLIQIGGTGRGHRPFVAAKPDFCYVGVDGEGQLWIDKQTGPRQKTGAFFTDGNPRRMIFVGERKRSGKTSRSPSGGSTSMAAAGVLERIGPMRYRLAIPRPDGKHKLELLELTPAPIQLDE